MWQLSMLAACVVWWMAANQRSHSKSKPIGGYVQTWNLPTMWKWGEYMSETREPRGIRNNNPGNIEYNGITWRGLAYPPNDGRYCRFSEPAWGIRAMARVLKHYRRSYGLKTVYDIINRWAPPTENDTGSYVADVAARLDVEPGEQIDVEGRLPELVEAIIWHENGKQPYSRALIKKAVNLS